MKKIILTLMICGVALYFKAADPATVVVPTTTQINNFTLYPTVNIYTFLKLDTRNGRIWQIQYSMDENEFEVTLNDKELVTMGKSGQFALYPTSNNWTFLLLDTINGDTWHVQWSQNASERTIIPIRPIF